MPLSNWHRNLERRSGFWRSGRWYDLQLERRMPLAIAMLEELVMALPPLPEGTHVCDLASGTGNAAFTILSAYPEARFTLIDRDPQLLAVAAEKLADFDDAGLSARPRVEFLEAAVEADGSPLPGGPYDVVVATLALHAVAGHAAEGGEAASRYELLFQSISEALTPGGLCLVGDHVGTLGLFRQMKAMERVGFADVDCAWRQDDFFVCGGRRPE